METLVRPHRFQRSTAQSPSAPPPLPQPVHAYSLRSAPAPAPTSTSASTTASTARTAPAVAAQQLPKNPSLFQYVSLVPLLDSDSTVDDIQELTNKRGIDRGDWDSLR